jgi:3-oxoacyl-[acyl-carrier protein] reductase
MDPGIHGRTAIVCGASSGLGKACALALAGAGVRLLLNARDQVRLEAAAAAITGMSGARVSIVAADVSQAAGRAAILAACPSPDILVTNAGGPPPGRDHHFTEEQWLSAIHTNMLAPIHLIGGVIEGMKTRRWGRIINITFQAVKMPLPLLGLSNGARAGLTGYIAGLAREVAGFGVTVNSIMPGKFATERLRSYAGTIGASKGQGPEEALADMAVRNPSKRIGRPDEFGAWCAFIASEQRIGVKTD